MKFDIFNIIQVKEWIAIGVGAIIGYIFPYFIRVISYILNLIFRKELLGGIWHAYHFTQMHGKISLRYEKWKIKRGILNRLIIT